MKNVTTMRLLRHKYGISMRELAEAVGVSHQHISNLELGKYADSYDYKLSGEVLVLRAFENIAANRMEQARWLSEDISEYHDRLLDFLEDDDEL